MIQLITNKDGVVSIVRENILNVQNDIPRYVEYVDSALISNYDSIDVILTKGIPTTDVRKINVTFYSIKTD